MKAPRAVGEVATLLLLAMPMACSGSKGTGEGTGGTTASGGTTTGIDQTSQDSGCKCRFGGRPDVPLLSSLALAGLALLLVRRRRH